MFWRSASLSVLLVLGASFSAAAQNRNSDPLHTLDFLVGTWSAKTTVGGSAGTAANGTYTFRRDLAGHVLQRSSSADNCRGPKDSDCQHHDQLTVFADPNSAHGTSLYALYLDNEGHVIYYGVTLPDPHTAVFASQGRPGTPHFRLIYHLAGSGRGAVMTGSFEGTAPGSGDFHPYLRWSGTRRYYR